MLDEQRIEYLNPRDLVPSRRNIRSDPGDLAGLAETIREHGILQPLGVTREGDACRVVYGNRRREAAIVVGLDRVPCLMIEAVNDEEVVLRQMLENLQRLDLNDLDKAQAFARLLEDTTGKGLPQAEALDVMARTLGLSARQIHRYLRLLQLGPRTQTLIAQGDLGVTHGQHLADLKPYARQEAVAQLAVEQSLSAGELARLVAALQRNANIEPGRALEMLRRGEHIAIVEGTSRDPQPLPHTPGTAGQSDIEPNPAGPESADAPAPWEETGPAEQGASESGYGALEPTTRDGNRVRKIHTLDAFMDEVQRLATCVQEGDFRRLYLEDETGLLKARLAVRQLRYLARSLEEITKDATKPEGIS